MKKQKQNQNQLKSLQSSFSISNNIEQVPTDFNKVVRKNGYKVVKRGDDNLLPYTISDIVRNSVTLSSIIASKAEYVSNGGLETDTKLTTKLNEDLNPDYDWRELFKRLTIDYNTFGYAFIERVEIGQEIYLFHLPTSEVCFIENDKEVALISKDWRTREKPTEIGIYPNQLEVETDGVATKRSLLFIQDYDTSISVYGLPNWIGSYYDAQVESLIGQYNANQFENGVTLSSILTMDFGDVTDATELKRLKKQLEFKLKGTSNGRSGKTLVVAKNAGVEKPEYVNFPMEKEGSFEKLQETTENNIVKACKWFRSILGLQTAGSLGNNQQIKNEWLLAERQINNTQQKFIKVVLMALGLETDVVFNNSTPLDLVSDMTIVKDLLLNKEALGDDAVKELLLIMGLKAEQAEKIVNNDSN